MTDKNTAMRDGGQRLAEIKKALYDFTDVAVTPAEIEAKAQELIRASGGEPSFAKVPGYDWATCVNLNEGVVHGIPTGNEPFVSGDVVSVDMGIFYQGYHTDTSFTKVVGESTTEKDKFLATGREALEEAISVVKAGAHVGEISQVMQATVEAAGYNVSRHLTGHGVGKTLHEEPNIPCYLDNRVKATPVLTEGQTIAIEVIYMMGDYPIEIAKDGWTIVTSDGRIAAVFEETVEVTSDGHLILTRLT